MFNLTEAAEQDLPWRGPCRVTVLGHRRRVPPPGSAPGSGAVTQPTETKNGGDAAESASDPCFGPDWRGLAPKPGRVCGGAKVGVLFSKSPRGGRRDAGYRRRPNPLLNSLKNGSPLGVLCDGGVGLDDRRIAETLICFES